MKRRQFMTFLGGAAAWPLAARAQQAAMPVIGILGSETAARYARPLSAFRDGLAEAGYVEGRTVGFDYRWADGQADRLPALAADLVHRSTAVIVTIAGVPAALAAKMATATIPIVFEIGTDPVAVGLVDSLSRPSGNVTGVVNLNSELGPKRLELLRELLPAATRIAVLFNPANPSTEIQSKGLQVAARKLGLELHLLHANTESDLAAAFLSLTGLRADALLLGTDPLFGSRSEELAALTLRHAVPAIGAIHEFATAGGLASYAGNLADGYRMAGLYTGRIIKGEKSADLPIQQATKVELIVNLKTAKALGITVPATLLARADEVIE